MFTIPMEIGPLSLWLLIAMFFLLGIGMPLGFASAALAVLVLVLAEGPDGLFRRFGSGQLNVLPQRMYGVMTDYVFISIPLFILMACLMERSGIARDMYTSLNYWLSRVRGGIAVVTAIMAVIMAAMSGIIGGEVVLLGLIALPQMLRLGYNQDLAIGTICASGSLGTMIPPSIVLIIYGLVTDNSIKALFTASFLPGFMLASFFIIYILYRANRYPEQAPLPPPAEDDPSPQEKRLLFIGFLAITGIVVGTLLLVRALFIQRNFDFEEAAATNVDFPALSTPFVTVVLAAIVGASMAYLALVLGPERSKVAWRMSKGLIAPLLVVGVVLGSIYGGVTGITEAAGMGTLAVLILTVLRGEISISIITDSLLRTVKSTGTILMITFGATALAGAYTIVGGPTYVADLITGAELPTMLVILAMMLIFLLLGALMDWVGIVLLAMPVFLPIVMKLPVDEIGFIGELDPRLVPIWFGVVFCMNMQVSFLSPPFGPAAFYLKSVAPAHISLVDIFRGFLPFICIQLLALSVLLVWPGITTLFLE